MLDIRRKRQELGLTLQQASEYAGTGNWRNLQRWQSGIRNLTIEGAMRLGVCYGCNWWELIPQRKLDEPQPVNAAKTILREHGIIVD